MSDPVQLEEKSESKKSKSQASKQSGNKSQSIKQSEKNSMNNKDKKPEKIENIEKNENKSQQPVLSTRAYLEQNVTPVVQEALLECARKRPNNPLEFVGNYILNRAHGK